MPPPQPQCARLRRAGEAAEAAEAGRLTGWLLESLGRVDDHMQEAVQPRSLLVWKTRTGTISQVLGEAAHMEKSFKKGSQAAHKTIYVYYDSQELLLSFGASLKRPKLHLRCLDLQCCGQKSFPIQPNLFVTLLWINCDCCEEKLYRTCYPKNITDIHSSWFPTSCKIGLNLFGFRLCFKREKKVACWC